VRGDAQQLRQPGAQNLSGPPGGVGNTHQCSVYRGLHPLHITGITSHCLQSVTPPGGGGGSKTVFCCEEQVPSACVSHSIFHPTNPTRTEL
jgi:hypothetical protein